MTRPPTSSALDASALLALLFGEEGAQHFVTLAGPTPAMSAVNWSEVAQKATQYGVDRQLLRTRVDDAGLEIVDMTDWRAERAADLWPVTRPLGLSLADRACLALALETRAPAVTADRSWARLRIDGLVVRSLR